MLGVGIGVLTLVVLLAILSTICLINNSERHTDIFEVPRFNNIEDSMNMRTQFDTMEDYVIYLLHEIIKQYTGTNYKFRKHCPDYLYYEPTGRVLEFDGYNKECNGREIGINYHGEYHTEPNIHNNYGKDLSSIKKRDEFKRKVCKKLGIVYIEIFHTTPIGKIRDELVHQLNEYRFFN